MYDDTKISPVGNFVQRGADENRKNIRCYGNKIDTKIMNEKKNEIRKMVDRVVRK